jgi:hypothetical protein
VARLVLLTFLVPMMIGRKKAIKNKTL